MSYHQRTKNLCEENMKIVHSTLDLIVWPKNFAVLISIICQWRSGRTRHIRSQSCAVSVLRAHHARVHTRECAQCVQFGGGAPRYWRACHSKRNILIWFSFYQFFPSHCDFNSIKMVQENQQTYNKYIYIVL